MKVYQIPEGIPNIKDYFPELDFGEVAEWSVFVKDQTGAILGESRTNVLGCCCVPDKVRIHFINSFGQIDAINFIRTDVDLDVKSDNWEKALKFPLNRTVGGTHRRGVSSNESFQVETNCFTEKDQEWISELAMSPLAWIEVFLPNGLREEIQKELIPINITDMKFPKRKAEKRYEYLVKIKFTMSNENINFR